MLNITWTWLKLLYTVWNSLQIHNFQDQADCIYTLIFMLKLTDSPLRRRRTFHETSTLKLAQVIVSYQHISSMFHQLSKNWVCYIISALIYLLDLAMFPYSQWRKEFRRKEFERMEIWKEGINSVGKKEFRRKECEGRKKQRKEN